METFNFSYLEVNDCVMKFANTYYYVIKTEVYKNVSYLCLNTCDYVLSLITLIKLLFTFYNCC